MTNSNNPVEIAKNLIKEGDRLVSEKRFDEALVKYHFVPKYAKVMGDHKLAATSYIKILEILIMKKKYKEAFSNLSLALHSAQQCADPNIQKKLIDLLNVNPELKKGFSEYRMMFSNIQPHNKKEKRTIKMKVKNTKGISVEKAVDLISVRTIREEYMHLLSIKCEKCQSEKNWNSPNQLLLLGVNFGKLIAVDMLSSSCKKCDNPIELYFDVESFFWNKYPQDMVEKKKHEIIESMKLKEGDFVLGAQNK